MATRARIWRVQLLTENSPFLASANIRQNGLFLKYARLADICQTVLPVLAKLADICQTVLRDSPTFAEPFCKDSPDLRKASLAINM
jgi:hypothetical protein